jgi:DNA-binding transcriptional MerR regulator
VFKISEFSRLSKVSLKTLRYYDQIGILKPSKVDDNTGYRYYSAEQLLELNRILIYKELGFTLPQISQLLHEDISVEHIQGMFRLKKSEIETIIETEQTKLARIEERMLLIEKEGQVETGQEIRIKAEEAKLFLYLKARGNEDHIPSFFDEFQCLLSNTYQHLAQGPQVVLWREVDEKEDEFEFEVGYFVADSLTSIPPSLQLKTLPAEPMMATMAFQSNANFAGTACVDLAKWIQKNNYQIKENEPGREIYLPLSSTQDAQLMEIQIPIKI